MSKNKFEESWQKAFDDASVPPPERVWEGIESHLNHAIPIPAQKSSKWSYLLASLVLLLILGPLGWIFWNNSEKEQKTKGTVQGFDVNSTELTKSRGQRAEGRGQKTKGTIQSFDVNSTELTKSKGQEAEGKEQRAEGKRQKAKGTIQSFDVNSTELAKDKGQVSIIRKAAENLPIESVGQSTHNERVITLQQASKNTDTHTELTPQPSHEQGKKEVFSSKKNDKTPNNQELLIAKTKQSSSRQRGEQQTTTNTSIQETPPLNQTQQPQVPNEAVVTEESISTTIKRENWIANYLKNKSLSKITFSFPTVSVTNQPPPFIKPVSKRHLDWWLGINLMVNRFNPNAIIDDIAISSITAVNSISGFNALVGQKPFSISQPGDSYLIGFQAGVAISKHVFIESGVQYWRGNSWLESDALIMNRLDSKRADLYNSFLANNQVIPVFSRQNVLLPTNSPYRVQNVYQYLSVPLRVGYRLRPFPKVETSVLAGASGDFFQKNTILTQTANLVSSTEYTRQDHWYRNLNLSGLVGVSVGYDLPSRWQVSADAQYRHAMLDGVNQPSAVHSRLTQWAIGLGLKRHF